MTRAQADFRRQRGRATQVSAAIHETVCGQSLRSFLNTSGQRPILCVLKYLHSLHTLHFQMLSSVSMQHIATITTATGRYVAKVTVHFEVLQRELVPAA